MLNRQHFDHTENELPLEDEVSTMGGSRLREETSALHHACRQELQKLPPGLCTRFAPSPTGYLHLGHAMSALFVWGIAQVIQADVVLRIEDHDSQRSQPEFIQAILEDLDWLGFHSYRSETSSQLPRQYLQSEHPDRYREAAACLNAQRLLYSCCCSRAMILDRNQRPAGADLYYDGHCRTLNGPEADAGLRVIFNPASFSFKDLWLGEQSQTPATQCGDLLLRDRLGQWTYNFAVAVDDIDDHIDLIIRGQDLLDAAGRQLQLRQLLGKTQPLIFLHHPLIWAAPAQKLSKRIGSEALRALRLRGIKPGIVLGQAAQAAGLTNSVQDLSVQNLGDFFA